jgi:hypothetical protein
MTKLYILNEYYVDLIKKLKTVTKKHKDKSTTAKKVFNIIKNNYLTIDKNSDQYLIFLKENLTEDLYKSYKNLSLSVDKPNEEGEEKTEETTSNDINKEKITNWLKDNNELNLFEGITLGDITKILRNEYLSHHYLSVFFIFSKEELTDEQAEKLLELLNKDNYTEEDVNELEDTEDYYKTILQNLLLIKNIKIKSSIDMNMGGMENTTLGKLAKEILEDVDINKLQKSVDKNGDVLKSLGDPDSGFGDIISNVSQKMATKLSNGELNQQNLMQDAMKFASMMPGMFGQNQGGRKGGGGGGGGPNMANMMGMFADMMNNNGDDMPDLNNLKKAAKSNNTSFNEPGYRKVAAQKKLKKKLAEKNKQ